MKSRRLERQPIAGNSNSNSPLVRETFGEEMKLYTDAKYAELQVANQKQRVASGSTRFGFDIN